MDSNKCVVVKKTFHLVYQIFFPRYHTPPYPISSYFPPHPEPKVLLALLSQLFNLCRAISYLPLHIRLPLSFSLPSSTSTVWVIIRKAADSDKSLSEKQGRKKPQHILPVLPANGDSDDGVGGVGPVVSPPEDQWWVELLSPGDILSVIRFISASFSRYPLGPLEALWVPHSAEHACASLSFSYAATASLLAETVAAVFI